MLSKRYLLSVKNLTVIMHKIIEGTAPEKFTNEHLKKIGFASSNDRAVVGLLKDLGFLTDEGIPTQRYHDYRNESNSKKVLGYALKETYRDIFLINTNPSKDDKVAISGLFKTVHNVSERVSVYMANTFLTLLEISDISQIGEQIESVVAEPTFEIKDETNILPKIERPEKQMIPNLRYNIEIHLPATKDVEVYNSIFKSLKSHLLDE